MLQDAKSDRVKQLLKETEKYLQKLGSKLQEAKTMATRFEHAGDETGPANIVDKSETAVENEDESDQAKASFFPSSLIRGTSPLAKSNKFNTHCVFSYLHCSIIWRATKSTI